MGSDLQVTRPTDAADTVVPVYDSQPADDTATLLARRDAMVAAQQQAYQDNLNRRDTLLSERGRQIDIAKIKSDNAESDAANQAAIKSDGHAAILRALHGAVQQPIVPQAQPSPQAQLTAQVLMAPVAGYAMTTQAPQMLPPHIAAMRTARDAVNRAMMTTLPATAVQAMSDNELQQRIAAAEASLRAHNENLLRLQLLVDQNRQLDGDVYGGLTDSINDVRGAKR